MALFLEQNNDNLLFIVVHPYKAEKCDELSFVEGQIIKVNQKLIGGWYEGTLVYEGMCGWFPISYTTPYIEEADEDDQVCFTN